MKKLKRTVTIEDVAAGANVSIATVSRVLNESELVSEETALRVKEAISRLGYVPNLSARNLRKRESGVILILAPNFTNPYYSHILSGIGDAAQELGYSAFICSVEKKNQETVLKDIMETKRADGAILLTCNYDDIWLRKYEDKFPMVQCSEAVDQAIIPYVSIDNYKAMCDSVSYCKQLGHQQIGLITNKNKFTSSRLRKEGYRDTMIAGLDPAVLDTDLICEVTDYGFESGQAAAAKLLSRENRPTAIVCGSDVLALGAIAAANEMNLSVPEDVSIIGFDDVDYTKMFHPYLTTIAQPCYDLGFKSMQVLQKCIVEKSNSDERIVLPHILKVRETTKGI